VTRELTVTTQMISADLLRLRKKRGVVALALLVVFAPVVIVTGFEAIRQASDPAHYRPTGSVLTAFADLLDALGISLGPIAAILIGAEAGVGDLAAGVFRDNVLTGRSRTALFLARIPAAVAITLAVIALGFAIGLAAIFGLAGRLPTPSLVLEAGAWLVLANAAACVIALGLGSLTGSRPVTITALISWQLVLSPLIVGAMSLGSLRRGLLGAALVFLEPGPANGAPVIVMPVAVAVVVTIGWLLVLPALGGWRMRTRDA
jgi:ABC-type transport system involved in multi-copper enzyme maturation permease subunit